MRLNCSGFSSSPESHHHFFNRINPSQGSDAMLNLEPSPPATQCSTLEDVLDTDSIWWATRASCYSSHVSSQPICRIQTKILERCSTIRLRKFRVKSHSQALFSICWHWSHYQPCKYLDITGLHFKNPPQLNILEQVMISTQWSPGPFSFVT